MRGVRAGLIDCANRLQNFAAVMAELEDGFFIIVHHPDAFLRIVRIDVHGMRALKKTIPLGPVFGNFSVCVDHHQRVFPARVNAFFTAPFFVGVHGQIAGSASARQAGYWSLRCVTERNFGGGK
jgi:hypothetical protein